MSESVESLASDISGERVVGSRVGLDFRLCLGSRSYADKVLTVPEAVGSVHERWPGNCKTNAELKNHDGKMRGRKRKADGSGNHDK
jgi:hypothetical protein